MEPGEYATNVISINNYASIHYEFFEARKDISRDPRLQLRRVEASWRQKGALVLCDPVKPGIWHFRSTASTPDIQPYADILATSEIREGTVVSRGRGIYEPSRLSGKHVPTSSYNVSSNSSSPSSSLENTLRNVQGVNNKAVQANGAQTPQDAPTPATSAKPSFSPDSMNALRGIHERFISAVLESMMYFLCRDHSYIPLNSRTLVVTPLSDALRREKAFPMRTATISIATLDISLTSLGTLVVKAHCELAPEFRSLIDMPELGRRSGDICEGANLWLAPCGQAAYFFSALEGDQMPAAVDFAQLPLSPSDQSRFNLSSKSIKAWKSSLLEWLGSKGLDTAMIDSEGWILVRVVQGSSHQNSGLPRSLTWIGELSPLPWPAVLCFQARQMDSSLHRSTNNITGGLDPLAFAEAWFTSKEERARAIVKHKKDRQVAEAQSREQIEGDSRALLTSNFSPAALRRGSNAGAIYPTPPDAIQQPVGATPSFDGTVSTPGNPNHFFTADADTVRAQNRTSNSDAMVWDSADGRQPSTKPNVHFQDSESGNDNDNLFSDIGGDLFGDTDITDADFNFFDEPDALPTTQNPDVADTLVAPSRSEPSDPAAPANNRKNNDHTEPGKDFFADLRHVGDNVGQENSLGTEQAQQLVKKESPHPEEKQIVFKTPPIPQSHVQQTFDKEAVFKLLSKGGLGRKRSEEYTNPKKPRRASAFNKVEFDSTSLALDDKYGVNGRFGYVENNLRLNTPVLDIPKTEYMQRRKKSKVNGHRTPQFAQMFSLDDVDHEGDPMVQDLDLAIESDATSPASELDDTNQSTDGPTLALQSNLKRKRGGEIIDGGSVASSFQALCVDQDQSVGTPCSSTGDTSPMFGTEPADWSLAPYIRSPIQAIYPTILSDTEFMATAQILADQAVSSTLALPNISSYDSDSIDSQLYTTRTVLHSLTHAAKTFLTNITICSMRSFLEIQGIPVLNQALRLPPRPTPHPRGPNFPHDSRTNHIFALPLPRLEVRRADTNLTVLPSAVSFWDNLGLGPSQGPKDISAVCVHPAIEGISGRVSIFLDEMRSIYESYRFGTHERLESQNLDSGMLPLPMDSQQSSQIYTLAIVKETMAKLNKALLSAPPGHEKNIVVYCVYDAETPGLLVHMCSAFEHLFVLYRKGLADKKISVATELVLQLIPLDFVASPTALVVPKPTDYARLAMEVYGRCIDFNTSSTAPAIQLERPFPKGIEFKLNSTPSPSLLQENSCLHIAYAQSIDDRWITAAWTDNRGCQQMTASYCLGRKNEPISTPFSDVAHEIWKTTLGIFAHKKIHWRLMITKVGVMDPSEMEFWTGLASTESEAHLSLTLISANTNPSLQVLPEAIKMAPTASSSQSVPTPVSTPQAASIVSPDSAATPMREPVTTPAPPNENAIEPDSDARLIDLTDQSWGAVLSHRLNNSRSLLEFNPALISGYLVKRGGTNNSDAPVVIEVNIMHSDSLVANPRTFHEGLLREVIVYFRGLATIAKVRGVADGVRDGRPWHIAAAEKAVKALYTTM
ncbi:hypothetical protein BP6252_06363 [Coleophoma cylindrospora]|uniref:Mediator of RNA polymerase II transcription subunit 13 n=1 Tax=Coleophoma cylindrospora TaxID=1849047 RepID=A0A3D8RN49_9HELO|nr:hypothetical protein BP6252_06363 [Coleophoma cylindrospora]